MARISLADLQQHVEAALLREGASPAMAASTAACLVKADAQGLSSHGVSRLWQYVGHLRNGRAVGSAVPVVAHEFGACSLIDAKNGLAFAACDLAVKQAIEKAVQFGIGFSGVTHSHHFGVAALHLDAVAQRGMVGIALSNSPAAMPAWGGKRALFGTNPVAAIFPRKQGEPVTIDLSLSEVARGKLMVAAKKGEPIPLGWALDANGQPTTDPQAGLDGTMCPAGGVKGAMLALMVELLCTALTGAALGFEADSFFVDEGNQPSLGHAFLVINPGSLAGNDTYFSRVETLLDAMLEDDGVRLPGERRRALAALAATQGVDIPDSILGQLG